MSEHSRATRNGAGEVIPPKWSFRAVYRIRALLMVPPMVFVTLCTWSEVEHELLVFGLGGSVFVVGLLMRLWAQTHLHYRLPESKVLTTTGPYSLVRNPIYIGNTIMLAGVCFLTELFWFAPIMLGYCALVYSLVVRWEESHLGRKYGRAYASYTRRVPRWLPRCRRPLEAASVDSARYLAASLLAEGHNLLLLVPPVIKELVV